NILSGHKHVFSLFNFQDSVNPFLCHAFATGLAQKWVIVKKEYSQFLFRFPRFFDYRMYVFYFFVAPKISWNESVEGVLTIGVCFYPSTMMYVAFVICLFH